MWPTASIPTYGRGVWLECNGQSFKQAQFPQLYDALGTDRVPNYQGMFLRGYGSQSHSQVNGLVVTYDGTEDGKLTNGSPTNTTYSSGDIGEIQGDSSRRVIADLSSRFFQFSSNLDNISHHPTTAIRLSNWQDDGGGWALTKNGYSNQIRAWGHGYSKHDDDFFGSIYDQKRIFFSVNPKHYKYNMSCSEDSCSLEEYTEPAESDEGFWTYAWANDIGYDSALVLPTANEFRPVNVAVKFMIKAK